MYLSLLFSGSFSVFSLSFYQSLPFSILGELYAATIQKALAFQRFGAYGHCEFNSELPD